jgi:hypothetical protein
MLRRSFMAAIGFAPVAAAMPSTSPPNISTLGISSGLVNYSSHPDKKLSDVEYARERLHALKEARKAGVSRHSEPYYYDRIQSELSSMKSWSSNYKTMVQENRMKTLRDRVQIEEAEAELARRMKLALLPEWVREYF